MKIELPVIDHMLKVLIRTPVGECFKVMDDSHRSFEIDIPDNVLEDEVEVMACQLDECGQAVTPLFYLKEAVEPEEKPDEDAHVEDAEEAPESPPVEEAGGMDEEEVTCGPQILLDVKVDHEKVEPVLDVKVSQPPKKRRGRHHN
jgi:hypothetical protein